MCLIEWLLCKEKRPIQFGFQSGTQLRIPGPELRPQVVAILMDDGIEGGDGVKAHGWILNEPLMGLV
jgi:hypothetical protein